MARLSTLLLLVLGVAGLAAAIYWLASLQGGVAVNVPGWEFSIPLGLAVLGLVLFGGLVAAVWWLATGAFLLPMRLSRSRRASQIRKANKALADGLLAAEAGDAATAERLAKRAARYGEDERLKLLLEARAAEAREDWIEAERAWGLLTRLPGGELAGLRGAATTAIERGDRATAEVNARQALALKTDADWPFTSLFDLEVARGDWAGALKTLEAGEKRGRIEGDRLRRRRAVLETARAVSLSPDRRQEAQGALAEAIRAAPGFPPAAWHGARHLIADGKHRAAQSVLELAWKASPHPALARLARTAFPDEQPDETGKRIAALIAANPGHRESRVLEAEHAMDSGDWTNAVRRLAVLVEEGPTARLCLLMERALKGYGDANEAARWARMAASAAREGDWSDLDPKGGAFTYSQEDWSRLVYAFGDAAQLVHPRHEAFGRELEAGRAPAALAAPDAAGGAPPKTPLAPPRGCAAPGE